VVKPALQLTGEEGNAASILVRCIRAGRRAGWSKEQLERFKLEAQAGSYADLLQVVEKHFETS
jgi:hypothetical protein